MSARGACKAPASLKRVRVDRFIETVIAGRRVIVALFAILMIVSTACIPFVRVNYDMVDYLPPSAQSTTAVDIMTEQFDQAIPNTYVMVRDVTPASAAEVKNRISLHRRRRNGSVARRRGGRDRAA